MAQSGPRLAPSLSGLRVWARASAILMLTASIAFAGSPDRSAQAVRDRAFADFIVSLRPMAAILGVSRKTFDHAFEGVAFDPAVIAETRRQAG